MVIVKDIILKPIKASIANDFVKKHHYSGKVVQNSQLHFGAFYNGVLHGVMSYGPSLDKSKIMNLVKNTGWNDFLELNRMTFDDYLPKNSESRCISISMKLIKKHYPHIKWIISFADGTQCGDGCIYRASGFKLTALKKNSDCMLTEKGVVHTMSVKSNKTLMNKYGEWKKAMESEYGKFKPLIGFQFRYIYFIDKSKEKDLAVPIIPYCTIDKIGAGMYKGNKITIKDRRLEHENNAGGFQSPESGAVPTETLQR